MPPAIDHMLTNFHIIYKDIVALHFYCGVMELLEVWRALIEDGAAVG